MLKKTKTRSKKQKLPPHHRPAGAYVFNAFFKGGKRGRYWSPSFIYDARPDRAARPEEIFAQLLECAVREADPADGWPRENLGRGGGLAALM